VIKSDQNINKITLTLYLGVLLILGGFYFIYMASNRLQTDIQNMNKLHVIYTLVSSQKNRQELQRFNEILKDVEEWTKEKHNSPFYISSNSLDKEFEQFIACQKQAQDDLCTQKLKHIIFSVNNMVLLEENRLHNILYISFTVALALFVILIFLIRAYIAQQLHKKALLDVTTKLYSKDYLIATMKELTSRHKRVKEDLSACYCEVSYSEENLKRVAEVLLDVIRESDIACRYTDNGFIIIFPHTDAKSVEKIIHRLKEKVNDIEIRHNILEYNSIEDYKGFIEKLSKV